MSSFGLMSLISAFAFGTIAYGVDASPDLTWQKLMFFLCLTGALASLIGNTLSRPSLLWEIIDEMRNKRPQQAHDQHTHHFSGEQHG